MGAADPRKPNLPTAKLRKANPGKQGKPRVKAAESPESLSAAPIIPPRLSRREAESAHVLFGWKD
jgi:hypothetical protein